MPNVYGSVAAVHQKRIADHQNLRATGKWMLTSVGMTDREKILGQ